MIATILPGLPPYGPSAELFPPGWGHGAHEGTVVSFASSNGPSRVVNFAFGGESVTAVVPGIDLSTTLVLSRGAGYLVDDDATVPIRDLHPYITGVLSLDDPRVLILEESGICLLGLLPDGRSWRTRRLSWDGFHGLSVVGNTLEGFAEDPTDRSRRSKPFTVDLRTGQASGGSYSGPDSRDGERLVRAVAS